jgi:hypothetical protein
VKQERLDIFHNGLHSVLMLDESVLLDLKHLLAEAKQKIPSFLAALEPENEELLNVGGKYQPDSLPVSKWRDFL